MRNAIAGAVGDILWGLRLAPLWLTLGWDQTVSRFRRTVLGPFWLSANMFAIAFALSVIYGGLMGTDFHATLAPILAGVLGWSLIGGPMADASLLFIGAAPVMMAQKLPLSFHVFLSMHRIVINFIAQLISLWAVFIILRLGSPPSWQILLGMPVVLATMFLITMTLAFPATRFRDIGQLIGAVLQLMFFITPIIWIPVNPTPHQRLMIEYNPFSHLLAIIRDPMLGRAPALHDWIWSLGVLAASLILTITTLALFRKRIIFWI